MNNDQILQLILFVVFIAVLLPVILPILQIGLGYIGDVFCSSSVQVRSMFANLFFGWIGRAVIPDDVFSLMPLMCKVDVQVINEMDDNVEETIANEIVDCFNKFGAGRLDGVFPHSSILCSTLVYDVPVDFSTDEYEIDLMEVYNQVIQHNNFDPVFDEDSSNGFLDYKNYYRFCLRPEYQVNIFNHMDYIRTPDVNFCKGKTEDEVLTGEDCDTHLEGGVILDWLSESASSRVRNSCFSLREAALNDWQFNMGRSSSTLDVIEEHDLVTLCKDLCARDCEYSASSSGVEIGSTTSEKEITELDCSALGTFFGNDGTDNDGDDYTKEGYCTLEDCDDNDEIIYPGAYFVLYENTCSDEDSGLATDFNLEGSVEDYNTEDNKQYVKTSIKDTGVYIDFESSFVNLCIDNNFNGEEFQAEFDIEIKQESNNVKVIPSFNSQEDEYSYVIKNSNNNYDISGTINCSRNNYVLAFYADTDGEWTEFSIDNVELTIDGVSVYSGLIINDDTLLYENECDKETYNLAEDFEVEGSVNNYDVRGGNQYVRTRYEDTGVRLELDETPINLCVNDNFNGKGYKLLLDVELDDESEYVKIIPAFSSNNDPYSYLLTESNDSYIITGTFNCSRNHKSLAFYADTDGEWTEFEINNVMLWIEDAGIDSDGDGWNILKGPCGNYDCDDTDSTINPEAKEAACDGIDQNCDGYDFRTYDLDGDGYYPGETCTGEGETCATDCEWWEECINTECITANPTYENECDKGRGDLAKDFYAEGGSEFEIQVDKQYVKTSVKDTGVRLDLINSTIELCMNDKYDGMNYKLLFDIDLESGSSPVNVIPAFAFSQETYSYEIAEDKQDYEINGTIDCTRNHIVLAFYAAGDENTEFTIDDIRLWIEEPEVFDCDDTDSSINPGATEVACDGIDQDCDGSDYIDSPTGVCEQEEEESTTSTSPLNNYLYYTNCYSECTDYCTPSYCSRTSCNNMFKDEIKGLFYPSEGISNIPKNFKKGTVLRRGVIYIRFFDYTDMIQQISDKNWHWFPECENDIIILGPLKSGVRESVDILSDNRHDYVAVCYKPYIPYFLTHPEEFGEPEEGLVVVT